MAAESKKAPLPVTEESYLRAEVDLSFEKVLKSAKPNEFRHDRNLMPLDKQPAVTMNRDTVYSFNICYVPKGTTITLPETPDGRYLSAQMLDNEDYSDQVFYAPGTFEIKSETEFAAIICRTQINNQTPEELETIRKLQDGIKVNWPTGTKLKEYQIVHWNRDQLLELRKKYQKQAAQLPNFNDAAGAHGVIDPKFLRMSASVALGLLPAQDACYLYRDYGLKGDQVYSATYQNPGFKKGGFFSFTMYDNTKHIASEDCVRNNNTIKFNDDGTFTMYYGPKKFEKEYENYLTTPTDDWYLAFRVYRPENNVISGNFELAEPKPVKAAASA